MRILFCLLSVIYFLNHPLAIACTALNLDGSGESVAAVNIDFISGAKGAIVVNKRGLYKVAADLGGTGSLATWRSKWGSLAVTFIGREFAVGGINEAGLIVHMLQGGATYPDPNGLPGIYISQVPQFLLDTSATVAEAIQQLSEVRPWARSASAHYWLCDKNSNCAVIDYQNKKMVVYSGLDLPVNALTNTQYHAAVAKYFECLANDCSALQSSLDR